MRFTIAIWLLTRLLVLAVMSSAAPHGLVSALGNWDGAWYGDVAMHGYSVSTEASHHNVAFFPLFPMIASLLVRAGVTWPLAGAVVNAAAFLAAALAVFALVRLQFDETAARWSAALLCLLPESLFCTVAYSEALFLLCSAVALLLYKRGAYVAAGIAAAAASATRPLGIALACALVLAAVVERKGARAVSACAIAFAGIAAFAAFCYFRFGDALAFVHAQTAWRHGAGFDWAGWLGIARGAAGGRAGDWFAIGLVALAVLCITVYRTRVGAAGSAYVAIALLTLLAAGTPFSLDRNLYGVLPVIIAGALLFRRVPLLGYGVAIASLAVLAMDAAAFARFAWVA
jgi:hypothetical protein